MLIKPETSLEAKRTNLKLSYFGHITRRQGSLEKTIMVGKQKAAGTEGDPNVRWMDSIKEATGTSLQELGRAAGDRTGVHVTYS